MRLNLTQHKATSDQKCQEPVDKKLVQALLTFESIPTAEEIADRAIQLRDIALSEGATEAMIGGAPFLMSALETVLAAVGIMPLYAFSKREAIEKDGVKTSVFRHLGFVEPVSPTVVTECRSTHALKHPAAIVTIKDCTVYRQAVSFHPWKDRSYPNERMFEISASAESILSRSKEIEVAAAQEADRREANKKASYNEWVEALPEKISGYCLDRDRRELTDDVGNYYFSLPKNPIPLEQLEAWIMENEYIPE